MTITTYFRRLERALRAYCSGELRAYPAFEAATGRSGSFSFEVEYWDNSVLSAHGFVRIFGDTAFLSDYSFHYHKAGETVFRYDDSPHYPQLATFPHHRHVGKKEIAYASPPPTVEEVLKEVEQTLEKQVG
jgi:hypothetical protein